MTMNMPLSISALTLAVVSAPLLIGTQANAKEHIVHVVSDYDNLRFSFEPREVLISPGDTVTWINDVEEEHNIITYPGGYPEGAEAIESPYFTRAGERFSVTFDLEGTYQYHCMPHLLMGMKGEVIVNRRSRLSEFHVPNRSESMAYHQLLLEWFDEDDNLEQVRMDHKPVRSK